MTTPQVILVEDDEPLREGLSEYLTLAGFAMTAVGSGLEFFTSLPRLLELQVAVVDLCLPDIDGQRLVEHLREHTEIRIIVLTANNQPDCRVDSYEKGADLYMAKPVDSSELAAAIRSLAMRHLGSQKSKLEAEASASGNNWQLQRSHWKLCCPNGETLRLTAREFQLIEQLALAQGQLLSRRELCQKLYQRFDPSAEAALSTLIKRIRQRITNACDQEDPIRTAHGAGYCFAPPIEIF
jgi:DNA-binding response OmpR family regulator